MSRDVIVVDTETTGLVDPVVLEIAALNLTTGEEFRVVPHVARGVFVNADPIALSINRYYERRVFEDMLESPDANKNAYEWLGNMLKGNTFAGCNPAFDSPLIAKLIGGQNYHYRLWDLSAYAAGALHLDELPGLHTVCELLGVENDDEHSALGDARATAECFRILRARAADRRAHCVLAADDER